MSHQLKPSEQAKDYIAEMIGWAASLGRRLLPVLFAVSLVFLVYYLFRGYKPEFHSDSAVINLLAQEVLRERSYFPSDWNYVNGDLWVLFGQIFIIPLLPFFKNSYALHAFSGLVSSVIVLLSLWLVSGMVLRSRWMRLLVVTIFAGGVSTVMAENLYGQVSYGNVLYLAALTLYFSWRWLESRSLRGKIGWAAAFCFLNMLTFWGNPQRAAAYDAVPLLAAISAWAFSCGELFVWRSGARRWALSGVAWKVVGLCAMLVGSALIGTVLHSISIQYVNNAEGAGAAKWLNFEGIVRNMANAVQGMLGIFGAIMPVDQRVMSPSGIYFAIRAIGTLAMLVLMPVAVMQLLKNSQASLKMFGAFVGSGLGLFVFLQVTTTTPDMTDPVTSARYMLPFLALGVIAVASYAEQKSVRDVSGAIAWGVLLVMLGSLISPLHSFTRLYRPYGESVQQQLARDLRNAGLKYGYASYWNAGSVTVLSGGDVVVRQILLREGSLPMPFRHLASNHWYRPEAWRGPTFLALRQSEVGQVDKNALFARTGMPQRTIQLGDFTVWVFPENIAAKIPGWSKQRSTDPDHLDIQVTSSSQHAIGHEVDAGEERWLEANAGESGYLHFGPYVDLPAGKYRVELDVESAAVGEAGYVEVVSGLGANVLVSRPILGGAKTPLTFDVDAKEGVPQMEIRVFSNGKGAMTLRNIEMGPRPN